MKTPITYYGGKQMMAKHILPLIPAHNLYCEPFFGGGAIFFAKPKSEVEVINDLNLFVVNFYEQCKTNFDKLDHLIKCTLHSRTSHKQAKVIYDNPEMFSKLRRAWAFYVLCNQGFSGAISNSWGYGVAKNKSELRTKNKRESFLPAIKERLEIVQIERHDAVHVIKTRDRDNSFFYCDPPYYNADMAHYAGYTLADFENLLKTLEAIKGKFLLSSYPSDILAEYAKRNGWYQKSVECRVCVSSKGKRKIEMLTANYDINALAAETPSKTKSKTTSKP